MHKVVIDFFDAIKRFNIKTLLVVVMMIATTCYTSSLSAQNVNVTATLDSTMIFIGGQIDLKLEISQPNNLTINFPLLTDTITKDIEIVEKGGIDSLKLDNNRIVLTQLYRITSFDSGLHYISPLQFEIIDGESKKIVASNAMSLMVINPFKEVNPEKGLFDIKSPKDAPFKLAEILNYIYLYGGILLALGILIWLYLLYRKKRLNKGSIFSKPKPLEPAHIIALRELDKIKKSKLWEHNKVKEYYTEISNTIRMYIEHRYLHPALEQTSIEILNALKSHTEIDKKSMEQLKQVLELSDLVKFAKFQPLADENGLTLMNSYYFVNQTKVDEVKTIEEEK